MKVCTKCGEEKENAAFRIGRAQCKECINLIRKEYYYKNKAKFYEYNKKSISKNIEKYKERIKKRDKLKAKEYQKKHYLKNKEQLYKKNRQWAINNPDKVKEFMKEWKSLNKERLKELQKKWRQKNNDQVKEIGKNSRERRKKDGSDALHQSKIREELRDHYIIKMLTASGWPKEYIKENPELIELKRQEVKWLRIKKNVLSNNKNTSNEATSKKG